MSSKQPAAPAPKKKRRQQFSETYRMAKKGDPKLGLILLGTFLVFGLVGFGLFWLIPGPNWIFAVPGGILTGTLATLIVFGRRAQRSMYTQIEDQKGAAAAALQMLRRGWVSKPMVAFNKQQDVVHRVVGRPGIILIGEGSPTRLKQLMASERRKHERVATDTPINEVVVGRGEGQVPLPKLVRHLQKMPKKIRPAEMTDTLNRIKALDAQRSTLPLPKGPMPSNMKGMRQNMRGR
ncbi:DUF4191 domain-containing protein [Nocardioides alkalitolerans]|uniref:DUF4191 domain-containing protein n=1 Tax=Nocardioides alkalitolerans TaxID=281714 RepID=UPI0004245DDA|nr:DUF4191 domain-containing protein [Nocardioides alkalitolerans]